jgi:hypothetical protein
MTASAAPQPLTTSGTPSKRLFAFLLFHSLFYLARAVNFAIAAVSCVQFCSYCTGLT